MRSPPRAARFAVSRPNAVVKLSVSINGTGPLRPRYRRLRNPRTRSREAKVQVVQQHRPIEPTAPARQNGRAGTIQLRSLQARVPIVVKMMPRAFGEGVDGLLGMSSRQLQAHRRCSQREISAGRCSIPRMAEPKVHARLDAVRNRHRIRQGDGFRKSSTHPTSHIPLDFPFRLRQALPKAMQGKVNAREDDHDANPHRHSGHRAGIHRTARKRRDEEGVGRVQPRRHKAQRLSGV